jgi:hypothetical protein
VQRIAVASFHLLHKPRLACRNELRSIWNIWGEECLLPIPSALGDMKRNFGRDTTSIPGHTVSTVQENSWNTQFGTFPTVAASKQERP